METIKLADAPLVSSMSTSNRAFVIRSGGVINRYQPSYIRTALNLSNKAFFYANAWGAVIPSASSTTKEGWEKVGNYSLFEAYKAECGRYLMSTDGSKAAKLNKENSNVYVDGTSAPVDSNHTMCRFPRLYYHYDGSVLWMSQLPISDKYIEEHWVGAYAGRNESSKLVSKPNVIPSLLAFNTGYTYAKNNGAEFGLEDYDFRKLLTFLTISEYGSPNAAHHVGWGLSGSKNYADATSYRSFSTGATSILGDASDRISHPWTTTSGTVVEDGCDVSFMGVENAWGWEWFGVIGIYCVGTNVYLYKGNRFMTSAEQSGGAPLGDYRQVTRLTTNGGVQQMLSSGSELDIVCAKQGEASIWSGYDYNAGATGNHPVRYGGWANFGGQNQIFTCASDGAYTSLLYCRLAYYSQPEIVEKL